MKTIIPLFIFVISIAAFSCTKEKKKTEEPPITYNYKNFTYIGNTYAHYDSNVNSVITTWDTMYADSVIVKIDSAHDKIIFVANQHNPLGIYPQTEYDFDISSNFFRKTFVKNYYQQFNFEGDTLRSYFFKLQEGSTQTFQKEIKFAGSLKP